MRLKSLGGKLLVSVLGKLCNTCCTTVECIPPGETEESYLVKFKGWNGIEVSVIVYQISASVWESTGYTGSCLDLPEGTWEAQLRYFCLDPAEDNYWQLTISDSRDQFEEFFTCYDDAVNKTDLDNSTPIGVYDDSDLLLGPSDISVEVIPP